MEATDSKFLARTALILFIAGITVPFLIAIFASDDIAMGFGLVSEVLALILGILSWKHRLGKIAVIGVSVLLAMSGINYMFYLSARSDAEQQMRSARQTEAEQAGTEQPATRSESKSEGDDKPQPESEGRSR